jgi:hypothetical protein
MKRRRVGLIVSFALGILAAPLAVEAQQALTPSWTPLTPATPNGFPRGSADSRSTAYDAATDRLIVFGGFADPSNPSRGESQDTWVLINATGTGGTPTWTKLAPTGPLPPGRRQHSAVYDSVTNRMIIFGGGQFNGTVFGPLFNDVWVLKNANGLGGTPGWMPLATSGGPPAARTGHAAVYNPARNAMIIFGGGNNGIMNVPNDLWVLTNANHDTGAQWTLLPQTGNVPPPIEHFAAAYDPAIDILTITGGCCPYTNDSWLLTRATGSSGAPNWMKLSPGSTLPPVGDQQNFGYDPGSNRLIVQGPSPGAGTNATWLLKDALGTAPTWINSIPEKIPGSPDQIPPGCGVCTGSAYNTIQKKFILALNSIVDGNPTTTVWILSNADDTMQPSGMITTGAVQATFQGNLGTLESGRVLVKEMELKTDSGPGTSGPFTGQCPDLRRFTLGANSALFLDDSLCLPINSGMVDVTHGQFRFAASQTQARARVAIGQLGTGVRTPVSEAVATATGTEFTTTYTQAGNVGTAVTQILSGSVAITNPTTGAVNVLTEGQEYAITGSPPGLQASILPRSLSVQVGQTATASASITNVGTTRSIVCQVLLVTNVPVIFSYQQVNEANEATRAKNTPITILAGATARFVLALIPTAAFSDTEVQFSFTCGGIEAPIVVGSNTLKLSASWPLVVQTNVNLLTFAIGQTLNASGAVNNPGLPGSADFYVGLLRPDGSIQFFTSLGIVLGNVASLTSFRPLATAVSLATPFSATEPGFYSHQWTAADMRGNWVFFVAAVKTGALAGGTLRADQILGLAATSFSVLP